MRIVGWRAGLLVVLVSPTVCGPAALASGNGSDRGSAGDLPERVVLLHGLGRRASSLFLLEWRLEARGFEVCNIDYDSRVATIGIAADEVAAGIEACGFDRGPVHFVTDSVSSPGIDGSTRWAHSGCLALTMGQ